MRINLFWFRYNIEPFFFSSSLNLIPSRFQEEVKPGEGDREFLRNFCLLLPILTQSKDITITLTFLRSVAVGDSNDASQSSPATLTPSKDASYLGELNFYFLRPRTQRFRYINSQANDRSTHSLGFGLA